MPYIIIRGNLASYSHKYPWRVLVSGLKGKSAIASKSRALPSLSLSLSRSTLSSAFYFVIFHRWFLIFVSS